MTPLPIALAVSALIGLAFAVCTRAQFRAGQAPWGREFVAILMFEGVVAWPVLLYSMWVHADWSWMYLLDSKRLPFGLGALILLVHLGALVAGWAAGWVMMRGRNDRGAVSVAGGLSLAIGLTLMLTRKRVLSSGTFTEFVTGGARRIAETKLIWAVGVTALGMLVGAVGVGIALWSSGRRFRE